MSMPETHAPWFPRDEVPSLLLIGAGGLGLHIAQRVAMAHPEAVLTIADIDGNAAEHTALAAQGMLGTPCGGANLYWTQADVLDRAALSRLLNLRPHVVVNATTLLPVDKWWRLSHDPRFGTSFDRLGFGPWISLHLVLADALAAAVRERGPGSALVNSAYPDLINPILRRWHGIDPLGFGNLQLLEFPLRIAVARHADVPVESVQVRLAAHYVHVRALMRGETRIPPGFHMSAYIDGREVALEDETPALLRRAARSVPPGESSHAWTAATAVATIFGGLGTDVHHMPGPHGYVGGLPVRGDGSAVVESLPRSWNRAAVAHGLVEAQASDGVAELSADASVSFTDEATELYRMLFGADLVPVNRDNLTVVAREQQEILRRGFQTRG